MTIYGFRSKTRTRTHTKPIPVHTGTGFSEIPLGYLCSSLGTQSVVRLEFAWMTSCGNTLQSHTGQEDLEKHNICCCYIPQHRRTFHT